MEREEALQHFKEHEVPKRTIASLHALDAYYQVNKERLAKEFLRSFEEICRRVVDMQEQGTKGKLAHLTYSMLRTELLEGSSQYLLEATDSSWFFDPVECQTSYDASWAFRFLDRLSDEWNEAARAYAGHVRLPDIERIKLVEAEKFHQYVVHLIRYAMVQAVQLEVFQQVDKEPELEVRVGEYLDQSEIVYCLDTRHKDSGMIRAWLEEKQELEYGYKVLAGLDLGQGQFDGLDLRYSDLSDSQLTKATLRESVLVGTRWHRAQLKAVDFGDSLLHGADFTGANLLGASFREASGPRGLLEPDAWETPGFDGVLFVGADLTGTDFTGADLRGADFTDAILTGANFSGALLERAVFSEEARDSILLDELQERHVIWREGSQA
ncbi:pentapeptide repeat-containing protein [Brevibacillus sp. HB1.3]|uniref:pentapeptide repeat-containing protein n=1 Tax=Brevibacillus sp. HB1.3 TaxID=2738842 RepID=UPI00155598FB|nr:pentapeptide repeat-containing protein [Brevibacillus sp. HB1.3]NQF15610.1 pentapeptide repeat-containing protein [Brevibacillus sp. HB1.3]